MQVAPRGGKRLKNQDLKKLGKIKKISEFYKIVA